MAWTIVARVNYAASPSMVVAQVHGNQCWLSMKEYCDVSPRLESPVGAETESMPVTKVSSGVLSLFSVHVKSRIVPQSIEKH